MTGMLTRCIAGNCGAGRDVELTACFPFTAETTAATDAGFTAEHTQQWR